MMNLVMNEVAFAEDAIKNNTLGDKPIETINRVSRYYYSIGYKKSEIPSRLESFISRCDPDINIIKCQDMIDYQAKISDKYPLINIRDIPVTDTEIFAIERISNKRLRRLMFTLICLAKYFNQVNPNNNNWVNIPDKEIFRIANIEATIQAQSLMLNDLMKMGYIRFSKIVDNINVNVIVINLDGETVIEVTDLRNLGNQYMRYKGEPFFECTSCGAVVKHNSNRQKYCKKCAEDINRQKSLIKWRESKMVS